MFGKKVVDCVALLVFLISTSPSVIAGDISPASKTKGASSSEQPRHNPDPAQELGPVQIGPADNSHPNPSGSSSTPSISNRKLRLEVAERRKLRFEAKDINHSLREIPGFENYPGLPPWGLNYGYGDLPGFEDYLGLPFWGLDYGYDCDPAFCH